MLPATGRRDKFSWTKNEKTQGSQWVRVFCIHGQGRLMLWRKTNFSFSAKSGRGQPPHSELKDGTSGEANPAAMPVDLICSGTDGLLFGKKTRSAFFPGSFPLYLQNWTFLSNCRNLKMQTCHARHPVKIIHFLVLSELINVEGKNVIAVFVNPDAQQS